MTTLLAFVFVLGVLVFVHEAGHFLVAKWIGVRVNVFSLGFPPKLVGRKWGETEYRIGALPLGGYVKMAGDTPNELTGSPEEYLSRSKKERFAILLAGPLMNFVLAVVLFAILFAIGIEMPVWLGEPPVVQYIAEESPGADADVAIGDRIIAIDDEPVASWEEAFYTFAERAGRTVSVTLERSGEIRNTEIHVTEAGDVGVLPELQPYVLRVLEYSPAERAGIRAGDVIIAVDGEPIRHFSQFADVLAAREGEPVTVALERGGAIVQRKVTPIQEEDRWIIGIEYGPSAMTLHRSDNPLVAVSDAIEETVSRTGAVFAVLGGLVTGRVSPEGLTGPIGIASLSGESARRGVRTLLDFMAVLSINLAILNLLPIPLLDGGHATIILLEGLAGRDFSVRTKERILQLGFVFLLILMVAVFYLDLSRLF